MADQKVNNLDDAYSICSSCAKANGAIWPTGHCATHWTGTCQVCGKETGLCDVSDWDWAKGRKPNMFSILRRD
jgi:hypothetical protein